MEFVIWPWNTKEVAYKTLVLPQFVYVAPIWNSYHKTHTQIGQVENVQGTAARWRNTSSIDDTLAVPASPQITVLINLLFIRLTLVQCVLRQISKYLTQAPNLRRTRTSHDRQYTRYLLIVMP